MRVTIGTRVVTWQWLVRASIYISTSVKEGYTIVTF